MFIMIGIAAWVKIDSTIWMFKKFFIPKTRLTSLTDSGYEMADVSNPMIPKVTPR